MTGIVALPCLRCGNAAVVTSPLLLAIVHGRTTLPCRACHTEHYLRVEGDGCSFEVCYQRYTLKYPLEFYDDADDPPIARLHVLGCDDDEGNADSFTGPIVVYPRKKRFRRGEVEAIWKATQGRCHICRRRWRLEERSKSGWHIDHVIPHIGGGPDTERMPNFRVACGTCNLKKGKGHTEAKIRLALRNLIAALADF